MRVHFSSVLSILLVTLLLLNVSSQANSVEADAASAFKSGVASSRAGDFHVALGYFLQARRQGLNTGTLHHNLGVAHYRLEQYEEAISAFLQASQNSGLAAMSYYNLGLVETRRGDKKAAKVWFEKAYESAQTSKLRNMAAKRLGIRAARDVPYSGYLEFFSGYDSNPQLADDRGAQLAPFAKDSDGYLGALATGHYRLNGSSTDGGYVIGALYTQRYMDTKPQDVSVISGGAGVRYLRWNWQQGYQLQVSQLWIGGNAAQRNLQGSVVASKALINSRLLELRLMTEAIEGDDANGYAYLSGSSLRLRLKLLGGSDVFWRASYEILLDDRDDLLTADDRYSVSPMRHDVRGGVGWWLAERLNLNLSAEYRYSSYQDAEVRGGVSDKKRQDTRWTAKAGVSYRIDKTWVARMEVRQVENQSNFSRFDYSKSDLSLAVSRIF